jgi:glycosyltransferase involved in cell wall biosynthesis
VSVSPRVVLGMPAYNRPDVLSRTLESLFSQTFRDFALVIVDDSASPEVAEIVASFAAEFPRVTFEANTPRLGMVGNWRRVFARARELHPQAEYFAWVGDHDLWHARWLQEMVAALDANPHVVLAYPGMLRVMAERAEIGHKQFDTTGVSSRAERIRRAARYMMSGDTIYGLMRADVLAAAGVFRPVLTPDRQVLLAMSLFGEFMQVPEVLWYREVLRDFDVARQRAVFFPDGAPSYSYLPSHLQHFGTLLWDFGIRGLGRPSFGRLAGARYAAIQLWWSFVRQVVLPKSTWKRKLLMLLPPTRRRDAAPIDSPGI